MADLRAGLNGIATDMVLRSGIATSPVVAGHQSGTNDPANRWVTAVPRSYPADPGIRPCAGPCGRLWRGIDPTLILKSLIHVLCASAIMERRTGGRQHTLGAHSFGRP